jgi:hypothetical protein
VVATLEPKLAAMGIMAFTVERGTLGIRSADRSTKLDVASPMAELVFNTLLVCTPPALGSWLEAPERALSGFRRGETKPWLVPIPPNEQATSSDRRTLANFLQEFKEEDPQQLADFGRYVRCQSTRPLLMSTNMKGMTLPGSSCVTLVTFAVCALALATSGGILQTQLEAQESPTGRSPKLLWTPERQAVWLRMKADYESNPENPTNLGGQLYRVLKRNAECACRYGDNGTWATLMYQITGEAKYVRLAWARISQSLLHQTTKTLSGNFGREYSAELVVLYDWLYPGLSTSERQTFLANLNEMFASLLAGNQYSDPERPIRTADTDQTVGSYFGLAFLFTATADHNPAARELFSRRFVGGLDATASDRTTLRNAIREYVTALAAGGEWMESSEYNLGTVRLLLLGAEGVRTASGVDHFPEVTRFVHDAALRPLYFMTPDHRASVQWGDAQHPREFASRLFSWQTTNGILAGLAHGHPGSGPYIQQHVFDLAAEYGTSGYLTSEPWARFFFLFNPYAARATYEKLPLSWYAPGQGILIARDGWTKSSTLVALHMPPKQVLVDHQVSYFGDFQIYRKGEWAITHPISYGGPSSSAEGTNTMLIGGFSSMSEFKRVTAQEQGPEGQYAYISGTTGGQAVREGYYYPPPTFLHEWTRSLVYLPSNDAHSDTLVVHDRTNAENPKDLSKFERYGRSQQTAVLGMLALKQWVIHAPVEPIQTTTGISWETIGGQQVSVDTLLPTGQRRVVYDENDLFADTVVRPSERKWQLRILPAESHRWDTFLNVVQVSDFGTRLSNVLIRSDDALTEGVLVRRTGHDDTMVMFSAAPGPVLPDSRIGAGSVFGPALNAALSRVRLRSSAFSVRWVAGSTRTAMLLLDLNPNIVWSVQFGAAPAVALPVSRDGVGRVMVPGTGAQSIRISPGL